MFSYLETICVATPKVVFVGSMALRAGLEMGFWNFLATASQAIGLEHTTAVRSGFIIQASEHTKHSRPPY